MWEVLNTVGPDDTGAEVYAAFLIDKWRKRDRAFLISAIAESNLHLGAKLVLGMLVHEKLKRLPHRPTSENTELLNMQRALSVIDIERGGKQRKAAVSHTAERFNCKNRIIEKALAEHEEGLKATKPEHLDWIRSLALKSKT
jgi:hypothetical protein